MLTENRCMELVTGEREELEQRAANIITGLARDKIILGIPGGRSVEGIFAKLKESEIDWKNVQIFMIDERFVPIESGESNFRLANDTFIAELVSKGVLPESNVHPFKGDVDAYEEEFLLAGGVFDVILLSAGEDGHVASLFPGPAGDGTFITVENAPKPPPKRMSASRKLLEKSGTALLLFFGDSKKAAFGKFYEESVSVDDCPAKLVKNINNSYVLTDIE